VRKEVPQHAPKGEALRGEGNLRREGSILQPASGDKTLPKAP